jgi:DNA-directed RNA polymerase specialized sigma subunit
MAHASGPPRDPTPAELLEGVEKLIQKRVHEMAPHLDDRERADAAQSAREEAWKAAQRYRKSFGTRFTSYAVPYITGGVAKYLRGETRQTKVVEQARQAGSNYLAEEPDTFDLMYDDDAALEHRLESLAERLVLAMYTGLSAGPPDPEAAAEQKRERPLAAQIVAAALAQATPLEQAIKTIQYDQGGTMADVKAATGASESTIRRHHDAWLAGLRKLLEAAGIDAPPDTEGT